MPQQLSWKKKTPSSAITNLPRYSIEYNQVYCSPCCCAAFQPFNYANFKVQEHNTENISLFKPTWAKSCTPYHRSAYHFSDVMNKTLVEHRVLSLKQFESLLCTKCMHSMWGFIMSSSLFLLLILEALIGSECDRNCSGSSRSGSGPQFIICFRSEKDVESLQITV